jgi:hypothetical protein
MKNNEVITGMNVVFEDSPDAIVYTVEDVGLHHAKVSYTTLGGWKAFATIDICYMKQPTQEQLNYKHN